MRRCALSELISETIDMVAEPHEYGPESKLSRGA